MARCVLAVNLLVAAVVLAARADDAPAPPPALPTATAPAALRTRTPDGFDVELVGVHYEGDADLAGEAPKQQCQALLRLKMTCPADVPGVKFAAWDLTAASDERGEDLRARSRAMPEGDALRRPLTGAMQDPWQSSVTRSFGLYNLAALPAQLRGVKGKVVMLVAGATASKDISPVEAGQPQEVAPGLTVQIEGVAATEEQVKVMIRCTMKGESGPTALPYAGAQLDRLEMLDGQGQRLTPIGTFEKTAKWFKTDDGWKVSGTVAAQKTKDQVAKTLHVSAYKGVKDKTIEFGFDAIPLSDLLHATAKKGD